MCLRSINDRLTLTNRDQPNRSYWRATLPAPFRRLSAICKPRYKPSRGVFMFERILPFFLGLALLFSGGCARSYDGTVIIPKPLDARRFFDKVPPRAPQPLIETSVFPVAPQAPGSFEPRRTTRHKAATRRVSRLSSPPLSSSEPARPLTCRNVSEPGQRYRMVCE
jgi:hypothetical protein